MAKAVLVRVDYWARSSIFLQCTYFNELCQSSRLS